MYQFPATPMPLHHDVPPVPASTWHDEDDALDAWLASLSVRELERILNHLMEDPMRGAMVLDSTA
jgi:hypothetical protein